MAEKEVKPGEKFRCGACKTMVSVNEKHVVEVDQTNRTITGEYVFRLKTQVAICNLCFGKYSRHGKK